MVHAVALRAEHESSVAVERQGDRNVVAGRLPGQSVKGVVGRWRLWAQKRRQCAAQPVEQGQAVGVFAVGHTQQLLAQAQDLVGNRAAVGRCVGAVARIDHELANILHQGDGVAQRAFGLGHGIALHFKGALLGLDAGDAGERAFGLRGGHRVIAGAHHTLARGEVFLQPHQARLAFAQVAQGVVVHVGGANPGQCVAHVELRS